MTNYELLSSGYNNKCIAVDNNKAGKVFELGSKDIHEEYQRLLAAYKVCPELVPQPYETKITEDYERELLVMRRLYPLQPRAITYKKRDEFFSLLVEQVKELHKNNIFHQDIKRPDWVCRKEKEQWDNLILTKEGIKLIDFGSALIICSSSPYWDERDQLIQEDLDDLDKYHHWLMNN